MRAYKVGPPRQGTRPGGAGCGLVEREGVPVKLSLFDARDERLTLKTTQVGKVMDRAGIVEVSALLRESHAKPP